MHIQQEEKDDMPAHIKSALTNNQNISKYKRYKFITRNWQRIIFIRT
jgi:Uncharacterised protein family UPF0047.